MQTVGAYQFFERIGQGPRSLVHRARQATFQRDVALKLYQIHFDPQDTVARAHFDTEIQKVVGIEHLRFVPIEDYFFHNGQPFVAMRLMPRGTLLDLLRNGSLAVSESINQFTQIAEGLEEAHGRGLYHCNLKPSNILFDERFNAFISDFGLPLPPLTPGDPDRLDLALAYQAPEQRAGKQTDARTDIYALGILLHHMLTGYVPLIADDPMLPGEVEMIIRKATQPEAAERYQSIQEMISALYAASGTLTPAQLMQKKQDSDAKLPIGRALPVPENRVGSSQEIKRATGSQPALVVAPRAEGSTRARMRFSSRRLQRASRITRREVGFLFAGIGLASLASILLLLAVLPRLQQNAQPDPIILSGISGSPADAAPTANEIALAQARIGGTGFIAYLACSLGTQFQATLAREMTDYLLQTYGERLRVYNNDDDVNQQSINLQRALDEGAAGIILCPIGEDNLSNIMVEAQTARIPFVSLANLSQSYGGVLMGTNNYQLGLFAGRAAGDIANARYDGAASVVMFFNNNLPSNIERRQGMVDGLAETAPDSQIVAEYQTGGLPENGYQSMEQAFEDGHEPNIVLALNDGSAYGAIQYLETLNYPPSDIQIIGVNGEVNAIEYIEDGYFMAATVPIARSTIGLAGIDAIIKLLGDGILPQRIALSPGETITQQGLATQTAQAPAAGS